MENIQSDSAVKCPFSGCGEHVINTPRYIPKTRLRKNIQNAEFAKLQPKDMDKKTEQHQNLRDVTERQTLRARSINLVKPKPPGRLILRCYCANVNIQVLS